MSRCPTGERLEAYHLGASDRAEAATIELHLASCADCRQWLEDARANEGIVSDVRRVLEESPWETPPGAVPGGSGRSDGDAGPDGSAESLRGRPGDDPALGRYSIQGKIGAGGMGIVYEAEQKNPRRTVALKVIAPGLVSERALGRFELEAQLLGRLHHPGIAQIFEAGTFDTGEGPQPFFAMERVRGEPLDTHVEERQASVRDRLELFIKVCDAVHHAHLNGVVHRDLKPANILVTAEGAPKVLDFGVARATDGDIRRTTMRTEVGQVVGTLPYMSPEQLQGDPGLVDVRTDVFSLGVVLYELLAGALPHAIEGMALPEAVRKIAEDTPPRLGDVRPELRGDLETIVHKALEKDRARRFASAAELADDVRRFLDDEPIRARPPSTVYELRKFVRRHRFAVASLAMILLLLVTGVITTTVLLLRAWKAEDDARTAATLATEKQADAEREARDAIAARDFLQEVIIMADPKETGGRQPTLAQVLENAAKRVDRDLRENPIVQAGVHHTIGQTFSRLERFDEAEAHLTKALEQYEALLGGRHHNVGYVLASLAQHSYQAGKYDDAERYARRALSMRDVMPRRHLREVGTALLNLGGAYFGRGSLDEAEKLLREAADAYREYEGGDGINVAVTLSNLAMVVERRGRQEEAEELLRRSLELKKEKAGEKNPTVASTADTLASLLVKKREYEEAERLSRLALEIHREAYGEKSHNVSQALRTLADIVWAKGDRPKAVELLREALAIDREALPETHPGMVYGLWRLGEKLAELKEYEEAEKLLGEAVDLGTRGVGENHFLTLRAVRRLGFVLVETGREKEAAPVLETFLALAPPAAAWASGLIPEAKAYYGRVLLSLERYADAEPLLKVGLAACARDLSPEHRLCQELIGHLARLYEAWGKPDEAAEFRARLEPAE